MSNPFQRAMSPEVVELESDDGQAFGVLAADGESLVGLFPIDDPETAPQAFASAVLFLAAPRMYELLAEVAAGGATAKLREQCQEMIERLDEAHNMDDWTAGGEPE